jgi:hypothetical protein
VISTVALGVGGALYLKVERLEGELRGARSPTRETGPSAVANELPDIPATGREAAERTPGEAEAGPVQVASKATAPKAQTLEERITRLERRAQAGGGPLERPWRTRRFARNVDDLAEHLSLTQTQKARIQDVIDRGRQRIDDVLKIPDETGKSPYERREEGRKKLEELAKNPQPGAVLGMATDMLSYRERKIPGRNETYGSEIDRIRREAREEIATALDVKQREAFEQTDTDTLLGGGGHQVSFAFASGPDGEHAGEVAVLEVGTSVVTEEAEVAEEAPEGTAGGG